MINKTVRSVKIGDKYYPKNLENIFDPPDSLYYLGNLDALGKNIGIVGSRQIDDNDIKTTSKLVVQLVKFGFTIISGMAIGIDTVAHQTTIGMGGKTVAVLGAGVDIVYPPENRGLYNSIVEHDGLIISEIPPGKFVPRNLFAARNRIISGISEAVIVTDANLRSGSLITARLALEQGREVLAVPGSPGTDYLIDQGANSIINIADFLKSYSQ